MRSPIRPATRRHDRRRVIAVLAVPALLAVAACTGSSSPTTDASTTTASTTQAPTTAAGSRQPNVLFVLTDDLDLAELKYMPNVRKLLTAQGATFSNYFASVSLCCPSRSTILRGQYSHNTGVETNGGTNGGFETAHRLGIEDSTIGTWIQDADYRTAFIGKYLNGYPNTVADTFVPPGWSTFASAIGGNPYGEYRYTLNVDGKRERHGRTPADYGTDVYVQKTADFIERAAADREPFFAYLAVYAPHGPATPAPRHLDLFPGAKAPRTPAYDAADLTGKPAFIRSLPRMTPAVEARVDGLYAKRLRSLQAVDEGVAKLVETLGDTGQLANTYIVFTSDNGFHLGQFRMPSGKQTAYDFDIHLPLLVRGPGIEPGTTVDALAGNTDLAPTFAAMTGATPPAFVDGRSLLPLAQQPAATPAWRNAFLVEHWGTNSPDDEGRGDAPLEPDDPDQTTTTVRLGASARSSIPEYHGIRTERYLYVEYITGERELYDVPADPDQLHNIAPTADPALLRTLAARVAALKACKAATCRTAEDAPVPH